MKISEVDRRAAAGLHHVHQAEVIEGSSLLFKACGQINRKFGGAGETATGFFFEFVRKIGLLEFTRLVSVAGNRKRDSALAFSGFRVIVQRPMITRAVVAD